MNPNGWDESTWPVIGGVDVEISAKKAIDKMQLMCEQSLSPEVFEQWMNVRGWLEKTRSDLK